MRRRNRTEDVKSKAKVAKGAGGTVVKGKDRRWFV